MLRKKKICAGFDGNEHEDYIYKNINGLKYCKSCALKLQPSKPLKKMSEKQVFKMTLKKELFEEDKKFYLKIWEDEIWRDDSPGMIPTEYPKCECCKKSLGSEPNLMFFHHILEKRNYPQFRHMRWNIAIVCPDCHSSYESNPNNVPYLRDMKDMLRRIYVK